MRASFPQIDLYEPKFRPDRLDLMAIRSTRCRPDVKAELGHNEYKKDGSFFRTLAGEVSISEEVQASSYQENDTKI